MSKIVELYVVMVQRGLRTIDQVPARYREQVRALLEQVEQETKRGRGYSLQNKLKKINGGILC